MTSASLSTAEQRERLNLTDEQRLQRAEDQVAEYRLALVREQIMHGASGLAADYRNAFDYWRWEVSFYKRHLERKDQ